MILALLMLIATVQDCHDHAKHTEVDRRGDQVMGFSHEKTKHSFRLFEDGGAIEVRANDAKDAQSIAAIRSHFKEIEKDFTAGVFTKPEEIHAKMPDGAEVMRELRAEIRYRYEELPDGARLRVVTTNPRAVEAVHRFLKFQIADHRTGDSGAAEGHSH